MVGGRLFTAAFAATLLTQCGVLAEVLAPGVLKTTAHPPSEARVSSDDAGPGPKTVPRAYIVELNANAALNGRAAGTAHARFHKRAAEQGVQYEVRHTFTDTGLFHGLSVQLADDGPAAKAKLEKLPEVLRVWPVVEVKAPVPVEFEGLDLGWPVAPQYGFNTSVIRGDGYQIDYNLKMAGVEHLHSHGFRGKGVKVAIIDSGVDYRHPALGGKFGPGNKIAFGRNYHTDDGQGGANDPIATCSAGGHGTHVAGIVAGEDPKDKGFGLLGVAPDATLGMYRVFSCGGLAANDIVMQAMMDAVADGADIVSMSLGSDNGWERADPYGRIITGAKARGVAFIIAAGNSGHIGPFQTSSPSIAKDAVGVASVDSARYPTTYKMSSNVGGDWRYAGLWPLEGEFTVYAAPDYEQSLVCQYADIVAAKAKVESYGWNISQTYLMVRASDKCSLQGALVNAAYQGFKALLVWRDQNFPNPYDNNYKGSAPPNNMISLNEVDGPQVYEAIQANPEKFRLRFSDRRFLAVDNPSAGFTSNYSTMGNTWEYTVFKPLLAAPGHLILSTWPLEAGGYTIISGTSMATPFVAGCFALLKNAYPQLTVDEMINLFSTTAKPAKWWGDKNIVHSLAHQGAGTINVWDAYNSGTKFNEQSIVLGQSPAPVARSITFTNTLGRSKTFDITHEPAGLMQRTPYNDLDTISYPKFGFPSKAIYADVKFDSPTTVTLGAGQSATVNFVVTPPQGLNNITLPQYSGHIKFTSGRDVYTVPYMGITVKMNEAPVLERSPVNGVQMPALIQQFTNGQDIYPVDPDLVTFNTSNYEYLNGVLLSRMPADYFRLDVVAANTTFEPTYRGYNTSRVIETSTPPLPVMEDFGGAQILGNVFFFSAYEPTLNYLSSYGGYKDVTTGEEIGYLPAGDYRWLISLLPLEKNPEVASDWTTWLSGVIRIIR